MKYFLNLFCTFFGKSLNQDSKTNKAYIRNMIEVTYMLSPSISLETMQDLPIKIYEDIIKIMPELETDFHKFSYGQVIIDILLQVFGDRKSRNNRNKKKIDLEELSKAPKDVRETVLNNMLSIGKHNRNNVSIIKTPE